MRIVPLLVPQLPQNLLLEMRNDALSIQGSRGLRAWVWGPCLSLAMTLVPWLLDDSSAPASSCGAGDDIHCLVSHFVVD